MLTLKKIMCGIIGYAGMGNSASIIKKGLQTLEYRGYDSCGVTMLTSDGFFTRKDVGRVQNVLHDFPEREGSLAIGHTRWATHGSVLSENSHPHFSNDNTIAVVHNGIIENYQELKIFLEEKNFVFQSQTDTEVIPNLIQFHKSKGKTTKEAIQETLQQLEGSFALVIIDRLARTMFATRKESPLVIGVGKQEYFIASDIPAFLEYTKDVIYLHDFDLVEIHEQNYLVIYNIQEQKNITRKIDTVEWDVEQAKKGNFDHFLLKEITEQADVITRALSQDVFSLDHLAALIKKKSPIYIVGCGTAFHAAVAARYKFSQISSISINVCLASEFVYHSHFITSDSLVIVVSQSGETADVLEAIKIAKERKATVASIVNVMGSSVVRESSMSLLQRAGPEISVLSTKSYTSQVAILTLLAHAVNGSLEKAREKLSDLIKYIYYLTSESTRDHIQMIASKIQNKEHLYIIGRGDQYASALEAALKIKEVSYIHAEGFAGGELKHGTIALIEPGTPCIILTSKETEKKILSNAMEIKSRGAYVIGIGENNNEIFDDFIKVREAEEFNSICQIIPLQILAYQLAILRGCDPDKPRNLAKSVTVK